MTLTAQHSAALHEALADVDLTERDERLIEWLAESDQPTVDALVDRLRRVRDRDGLTIPWTGQAS